MEKLTLDPIQMKQLIKLGVDVSNASMWKINIEGQIEKPISALNGEQSFDDRFCWLYTAVDILNQLPEKIKGKNNGHLEIQKLTIVPMKNHLWRVMYCGEFNEPRIEFGTLSLLESSYLMLCYILENEIEEFKTDY